MYKGKKKSWKITENVYVADLRIRNSIFTHCLHLSVNEGIETCNSLKTVFI